MIAKFVIVGLAALLVNVSWGGLLQAEAIVITIDSRTTFQVMEGFGSSQRVFDDPHVFENFDSVTKRAATVVPEVEQEAILSRLYGDLGLTRVRPTIEPGIEETNDNSDPEKTDLSKFNFEWKRNDAHIDYVKRAMSHGARTYFISPLRLEQWMTESNPEEYVEWALAILRRWRDFDLEMPYYSIVNEPGYSRSGLWSADYLLRVVKLLGRRLKAEGFKTQFVITDDLNATEAYKRCKVILADDEARSYVGALAFHLYDEPLSRVSQMTELAETYRLPLWMTEYSLSDPLEWAVTMHRLISEYDVAAIDYMWGFFGQWTQGDKLINLRHSGAQYLGYTLTKQYFFTRQFSKWVRPGFRRIKAETTQSTVKSTAYTDGASIVVVGINDSDAEVATRVQFDGPDVPMKFAAHRTSIQEDSIELKDHWVTDGGFAARLPGRSITTFYGTTSRLYRAAPTRP